LTISGYTGLFAVASIVVVTVVIDLTGFTLSGGKVAGRITATVVDVVTAIGRLVAAVIGTSHPIVATYWSTSAISIRTGVVRGTEKTVVAGKAVQGSMLTGIRSHEAIA
jgi:hypothetical protein